MLIYTDRELVKNWIDQKFRMQICYIPLPEVGDRGEEEGGDELTKRDEDGGVHPLVQGHLDEGVHHRAHHHTPNHCQCWLPTIAATHIDSGSIDLYLADQWLASYKANLKYVCLCVYIYMWLLIALALLSILASRMLQVARIYMHACPVLQVMTIWQYSVPCLITCITRYGRICPLL